MGSSLATHAGRRLYAKHITLKTVADRAGTSIPSVFYVLSGRNRSKRIEAAVVELLALKSARGLFSVKTVGHDS